VLDRLGLDAEYIHGDIGWEFWCQEGEALPQRTLDMMKETDCAFFGAITSKGKDVADTELAPQLQGKGYSYRSPIVRMRQLLDLYICLRPCKAYRGNPLNYKDGIDLVVFRENTEGMYIGVEYPHVPDEFYVVKGMEKIPHHAAISFRAITPESSERIVRAAFDYARAHNRKRVTAVHKANVLRQTDGVFMEAARKVAAEYPGIRFDNANIDAMGMWLLKNPLDYDVIVTTNLFGDILSDEGAMLVGGLGMAPGANIGDDFALFEPIHGTAPDIAGRGVANPTSMILASSLMLDWLGTKYADPACRQAARCIEEAVTDALRAGVCTRDLGGTATTDAFGDAVAARVTRRE
jgi:isocitrate/isopropylmalate dehydrogenase